MQKLLVIALLFAAFLNTRAQSIASLEKDLYGIASDATEGRFTGSAGYLKAAMYLEAQLKKAGAKPGWSAGGKKTYLQPVPFSWDDYTGSQLVINGQAYPHAAQHFIITKCGITRPGKWIVAAAGDPVTGSPAGIVLLPSADQAKDWETMVLREYRFGYMHYLPDGLPVKEGIPTLILSPSLAKLLAPGDSVAVVLHYQAERRTGYNVIGIVPGADTNQRQAIIIGAHLDHLGRIGQHIYNGANDDASGCVAALGAAKMLTAAPIKRTVIVAFFCGEELDLKGSQWFAAHLPVPQSEVLLMVNLEQLASRDRSIRGVGALGDTVLRQPFYRAGSPLFGEDLVFLPTDSVKEVLRNTDTYSFMRMSIPSLLLGSGGFDEHHTPADKIDGIDIEQLRKATRLLAGLIAGIGGGVGG